MHKYDGSLRSSTNSSATSANSSDTAASGSSRLCVDDYDYDYDDNNCGFEL
jgi:hypothetical protein